MNRSFRLLFVFALLLTVLPQGTEVQAAGPCVCPQVYAPVECARGKVYSNQCVADCRHAKDCVPLGVAAQAAAVSDEAMPTDATSEFPWLDAAVASEVTQCAAERGVELYAVSPDAVETTKMMGKGKGKPNPCDSCATTLGPCARVSCSPCCYSCPDTTLLLCTE